MIKHLVWCQGSTLLCNFSIFIFFLHIAQEQQGSVGCRQAKHMLLALGTSSSGGIKAEMKKQNKTTVLIIVYAHSKYTNSFKISVYYPAVWFTSV